MIRDASFYCPWCCGCGFKLHIQPAEGICTFCGGAGKLSQEGADAHKAGTGQSLVRTTVIGIGPRPDMRHYQIRHKEDS